MKAGWEKKTLREVLSVLRNGLNCKQDKSGNGVKISRIESIADATFNPERVGYADLSETEKQRFLLKRGDILFSHINSPIHVGKTAIVDCDEQIYHGVNLLLMRPTDSLLPTYLNLALKYLFQTGYWARSCKQSVNQASVNQQDIFRVEICYPSSKEEQQRIVAILDEAFEAIAAARANAEQSRQNARALFESYLQSVFSQRGDGWVETTIAAATGGVFTGPFGSLLHKSDYIENGIPLVNPAHITNVGIEPDLRKTVSEATAQRLSSYIMRAGDIVIGRRGEMGRCAIVTDVENGWLCGTGSFVIKPSDRCDARYLVRLLRSESCKSRLEKIAGGAVMPNLSNTDLGNFPILLPPIDVQKAILEAIDALHKETQRLESLYLRKIEVLDELKQSLLQQAFSGNL